jgi:hypothetical protein
MADFCIILHKTGVASKLKSMVSKPLRSLIVQAGITRFRADIVAVVYESKRMGQL